MKAQLKAGAAALAILLAGCGGGGESNQAAANGQAPQLEQIPAPNNGDWAEIVTRTEQGGFLMGNPDAPVKLVEYASLTCPHCRTFSEEATEALRNTYVRSGQVSWEFRNFILGGPDMALSILARCQAPTAFFRTVEQIYEQQQDIVGRIDEAEVQRISALPPEQQIAPIARAMELDTFFARRGMPEAQFNQCLGNPSAAQELTDLTNRAATVEQVQGTPTFFINGEKQDADGWSSLEPLLRSRL